MAETLSLLARPLMSVAQAIWRPVRRVYRERQAGQLPFSGVNDLLEQGLDETMSRLCGGDVDDTWWRNVLTRIGHNYVAPDFLCKPALQEWLADEEVQRDVKALARARVMGADTYDPEAQTRLRRAYAHSTGEHERLADGPLDVVLAILAAGYMASIDTPLQPIAGMIQSSARENRQGFERMEEKLSAIHRGVEELGPNASLVQILSERAEHALNLLLKQRSLSPGRVRQELIALAQRVTEGDLRHVKQTVRAEVQSWCARVHATQPEILADARLYLKQLHQANPGADTRIVGALILETEGDIDGALRILRDVHTPDGRATFFRTLYSRRGAETAMLWFDNQADRDGAGFMTGLGWSNVAICLTQVGRCEEAADRLYAVQEHRATWPDLAFVEGVINVAMLLPTEWRHYALEINPFYTEIRPIEGPDADRRRARARSCLEQARSLLIHIDQGDRAQLAQDWLLWLRLTDPNPEVVNEARQEVQQGMAEGQQAVHLLAVAWRFDIEFNDGPLNRHLMQRAQTGGLNDPELVAELLLAELKMDARAYAEFLEREENRLHKVAAKATLIGKRIEALVRDGQIVRARSLLEAHKTDFIDRDDERLRAIIDEAAGNDPRVRLEGLYSQTGDLLDLRNLINHLKNARDWTALQPLLQELFGRERKLENALAVVESMRRNPQPDYGAIVTFLEANHDMVTRSLDLASEKAWALSQIGRLKEAEAINRRLLETRNNAGDLILDTNLSLQSGDWERFPVIIERAWPQREALELGLLMRLASLAAEADATENRALDLVKLATRRVEDDPKILKSAYTLALQLGCEEEMGAAWLSRAIELSSDEGPIWRVNIRTIVEEMMPRRRERGRKIEQDLLGGKIPLHAAAHAFSQPLSRLLIDLPQKNVDQSDGRRRAILPIISGARQMVQIDPEWTVGFDASSLMVLHHLGLLEKAIDALPRVVLAPETMVLLLNERRRVRFHQPSLVKKAEEIRGLIDRGNLKTELSRPTPPAWLVNEIGRDLAELLQAAYIAGGRVVHPYPIHKSSTFGEVQAELGEYGEFILSTNAFVALLHTRGLIDSETYARACQFLRSQDRDPNPEVDPSLVNRPLYLDNLAVGYLQKAGVLQAACHRGLTLFVHPTTKEYESALIEENRAGDSLAKTLNGIRIILRDALEREQAIFLPSPHRPDDVTSFGWLHEVAPTLAQILRDTSACDAVCIDDRFFNRHLTFTDEAGHTVPMICVLDLLQYLEVRHVISSEEKHTALYKLRQAGYALVPVPPDELEKYLRNATLDQDSQVIESAELRILRQVLMQIRSLDMVELPIEAAFLEKMQLGCLMVIRQLWADETLPVKRVVVLSDWAWRNVAPSPLDWVRNISEPLPPADIPGAFARHLTMLLQPMPLREDRYEAFRTWVEEEILEPLLPANADLVDRLAQIVSADIERLSEEFGNGGSSADR